MELKDGKAKSSFKGFDCKLHILSMSHIPEGRSRAMTRENRRTEGTAAIQQARHYLQGPAAVPQVVGGDFACVDRLSRAVYVSIPHASLSYGGITVFATLLSDTAYSSSCRIGASLRASSRLRLTPSSVPFTRKLRKQLRQLPPLASALRSALRLRPQRW